MTDAPKPIPLTVASPMDAHWGPQIIIGKDSLPFGGDPSMYGGYWIVVVDRKGLKTVYNEYVETYDTAPDLGEYDTSDYMVIVATTQLGTGHVPQGAFYDFLWDNGAGRELKRVVQLNDTLGCGSYGLVSYILVGVLGPGRPGIPGLEASSLTYSPGGLVMTAQLVPVEVGGEIFYSPAPLSE